MQQINIPLGGFPINLVCAIESNQYGYIGFSPAAQYDVIFDQYEDKSAVQAILTMDSIKILAEGVEETYSMGTLIDFIKFPNLVKWLKQLNLQQPIIN